MEKALTPETCPLTSTYGRMFTPMLTHPSYAHTCTCTCTGTCTQISAIFFFLEVTCSTKGDSRERNRKCKQKPGGSARNKTNRQKLAHTSNIPTAQHRQVPSRQERAIALEMLSQECGGAAQEKIQKSQSNRAMDPVQGWREEQWEVRSRRRNRARETSD